MPIFHVVFSTKSVVTQATKLMKPSSKQMHTDENKLEEKKRKNTKARKHYHIYQKQRVKCIFFPTLKQII